MTKHTPGPVPPFPQAIYGCDSCISQSSIEGNSHPPEDLVMITNPPEGWEPGWYCEPCADEAHFQNPDTQTGETLEHYLGLEQDKLKELNAELLAAMNKILEWTDGTRPLGDELWLEMVEIARLAIAKAEGSD